MDLSDTSSYKIISRTIINMLEIDAGRTQVEKVL